MKSQLLIAILLIALVPSALFASPTKPSKTKAVAPAAVVYECSVCHMRFSAADAKKDHYKDAMDGGKLIPVKPAPKPGAAKTPTTRDQSDNGSMPGMKM